MFTIRSLNHILWLQENDMTKKRPLYIKAKEKTAHMTKKIESAKCVDFI